MQKILIEGNLGRDAVVRESVNGGKFLSMAVACNRRRNGVEKTTWYDCISDNPRYMGNILPYLTKGKHIFVTGELDVSLETGNDGVQRVRTRINVDSLDFVNSGNNSGNTQTVNETTSEPKDESNVVAEEVSDDIPMTKKTAPKSKKAPASVSNDTTPDEESDLPF